MRNLKIITCQPNDLYFVWQLRVQLNNLRKYELSQYYTGLIWKHSNRLEGKEFTEEWLKLQGDFPEASILFYEDIDGDLNNFIKRYNYIPLLRPWLLAKHFDMFPELKDDAIFYMDSDVVFTKHPDFLFSLRDDDISYLSDTKSYIAASYFDSKVKDVRPEKLESYKQIDVLGELVSEFGLNREIAIENEGGSGGAQYFLKNVDSQFWQDVFKGCLLVRMNLRSVNNRFFESEDKGFQSWCADMWSVLFTLWRTGHKTKCPPEMNFAWATDPISKWDEVYIYHDAGAHTREIKPGHQLFLKRDGRYINNISTPFEDDLSYVSDEYCSKNYVKEIEEARLNQYPVLKGPVSYIKGVDPHQKDEIIDRFNKAVLIKKVDF